MILGLDRAKNALSQRLSLAMRVAIITTVAMSMTLGFVNVAIFLTVRGEFISSMDDSLIQRAVSAVKDGVDPQAIDDLTANALADVRVGIISGNNLFFASRQPTIRPFIGIPEVEVSSGNRDYSTRTVEYQGVWFRVAAVRADPGTALVVVQSMEGTRRALNQLRLVLILTSIAGVAVAGLTGWAVATRGLRPVERLTTATQRVARTEDLTPIRVSGPHELAGLTASFNVMLRALDASQRRQRQLVADAGHELRTPLTSLRTNIDLLTQATHTSGRSLSDQQRDELLADVQAQVDELTTLVGDLVELARDEPMRRDPEPVDLQDLLENAVQRAQLRAPDLAFDVRGEPWLVVGEPPLLERAVLNLLDNAAKWSPDGGTVTVRLEEGQLTVRDEGPGISEEDLPHVFDRFYRSAEARTQPGSGLGLSIVKRAAERHGGSVGADRAPGGGALLIMRLPGQPPATDDTE